MQKSTSKKKSVIRIAASAGGGNSGSSSGSRPSTPVPSESETDTNEGMFFSSIICRVVRSRASSTWPSKTGVEIYCRWV